MPRPRTTAERKVGTKSEDEVRNGVILIRQGRYVDSPCIKTVWGSIHNIEEILLKNNKYRKSYQPKQLLIKFF